MDALDGNAIGGLLHEIFGVDMTTAEGVCSGCGATGCVAEFEVYLQAPGTVARCRGCRSVLMVLTTVRDVTCVDLGGLAAFDSARSA
jgi:Family of unknown function (DUF6510)